MKLVALAACAGLVHTVLGELARPKVCFLPVSCVVKNVSIYPLYCLKPQSEDEQSPEFREVEYSNTDDTAPMSKPQAAAGSSSKEVSQEAMSKPVDDSQVSADSDPSMIEPEYKNDPTPAEPFQEEVNCMHYFRRNCSSKLCAADCS